MKKKVDSVRTINRGLTKAIDKYGSATAPRKQSKGRSFFDVFMDTVTAAPKKRR